jgi:hypothetical protein
MKKIMVITLVTASVFGYCGFIMGKSTQTICKQKHQNFIDDGRMVVIPTDTIDGRPTYSILFRDEEGLDGMYAEEIGYGLMSGNWKYDEDIEIAEIPKVSLSEIDK